MGDIKKTLLPKHQLFQGCDGEFIIKAVVTGIITIMQSAWHNWLCSTIAHFSCLVRDWALTEMMIEFFCLDATPGSSFSLLKLQLMLSLLSGDGSGLVGNIDQDKTYGRSVKVASRHQGRSVGSWVYTDILMGFISSCWWLQRHSNRCKSNVTDTFNSNRS